MEATAPERQRVVCCIVAAARAGCGHPQNQGHRGEQSRGHRNDSLEAISNELALYMGYPLLVRILIHLCHDTSFADLGLTHLQVSEEIILVLKLRRVVCLARTYTVALHKNTVDVHRDKDGSRHVPYLASGLFLVDPTLILLGNLLAPHVSQRGEHHAMTLGVKFSPLSMVDTFVSNQTLALVTASLGWKCPGVDSVKNCRPQGRRVS